MASVSIILEIDEIDPICVEPRSIADNFGLQRIPQMTNKMWIQITFGCISILICIRFRFLIIYNG